MDCQRQMYITVDVGFDLRVNTESENLEAMAIYFRVHVSGNLS